MINSKFESNKSRDPPPVDWFTVRKEVAKEEDPLYKMAVEILLDQNQNQTQRRDNDED